MTDFGNILLKAASCPTQKLSYPQKYRFFIYNLWKKIFNGVVLWDLKATVHNINILIVSCYSFMNYVIKQNTRKHIITTNLFFFVYFFPNDQNTLEKGRRIDNIKKTRRNESRQNTGERLGSQRTS